MLRILTCNLKNGKASTDSLARLLDRVKPHVVAIQELAPDMAEVIAARLPGGRLDPRLDFLGMGIALVAPATVEVRPLPRRPAYLVRLAGDAWPGFPTGVTVINAHLANPVDRPMRTHNAYRRGQVAGLVELVAEVETPLLLVGDFNSTPVWPAFRRLRRRLTDLGKGRVGRTWGPIPGGPAFLRIDHILGRGLRAVAVEKHRITGSDHRAVVAEVVLA